MLLVIRVGEEEIRLAHHSRAFFEGGESMCLLLFVLAGLAVGSGQVVVDLGIVGSDRRCFLKGIESSDGIILGEIGFDKGLS